MKTQLLEDIGQSATLSLAPSDSVLRAKEVRDIAQARAAIPVRPRSAFGVWRRKPDGEPAVLAMQQPDQAPPALETPPAVEPIAAVEAQPVPPQPLHEAVIPPVEPTLAANATQSESAPHGPVFDFTPPSPTTPALDLFKREPSWFERSGQRYLLWGACMLLGALVIQGGRWLYQERKDASALALVADKLKADPQFGKPVKRRAIGVKEFTLGPDGEVRMATGAAAPSPIPLPSIASTVPPLVLLKPEPATGTGVKPAATPQADREVLQAPRKPERVAKQAPAAPLRRELHRTERAQAVPPSKPARPRAERAPVRQFARESVVQAEKKPEPESALATTLKACRAHGYLAEQCVKHACSVTKYGFVCRGT